MSHFVFPVRVYYEDTDAGGVVYHANYLKFMERARTEWLRKRGFEQDELREKHGLIFVVRSVEVTYRQPAYFNELLDVTVEVSKISPRTIVFEQNITRTEKSERLVQGKVAVVCVDQEKLASIPIPEFIKKEMKECR